MISFLSIRRFQQLCSAAFTLALLASSLSAAESPRFVDSLSPEQRQEIGLDRLNSDNIAVINALVRQDENAAEYRNNTIRSTRFSQRRTNHEREISGLARLNAVQLDELDRFVGQRFAPPLAVVSSAGSTSLGSGISAVETVSDRRKPEIHGSFSLTYGWGKGGSVKGGDATLFYVDPDHRYSVLFNYSQYQGKGLLPCFYPGDPYYSGRPWVEGPGLDRP